MSEKIFTTKELASYCSTTKKTIRHYKDMGLLKPSYIDGNSYWYFNINDVEKLKRINQLKGLDLSLDEIKRYFDSTEEVRHQMVVDKKEALLNNMNHIQDSINLVSEMEGLSHESVSGSIDHVIYHNHLEWLKDEFEEDEINVITFMFEHKGSWKDHEKLSNMIKELKVFNRSDISQINCILDEAQNILERYSSSVKYQRKIIEVHLKMLSSKNYYLNEIDEDENEKISEMLQLYFDDKCDLVEDVNE